MDTVVKKHSKHTWKSNTLPAIVTVGPVVFLLILLVAVPLIYIGIMSFCSLDEYYNVTFKFTLDQYVHLLDTSYLKIYGQSILIALISTIFCVLIGYPFSYVMMRASNG